MAIGTTAAILGSAAIGAIGSAASASSSKKAINNATAAQQESNAATLALQRDIYGQNKAALTPFMQRGNVAGDAINALLGLGGTPANNNTAPVSWQSGAYDFPVAGSPYYAGPFAGNGSFGGYTEPYPIQADTMFKQPAYDYGYSPALAALSTQQYGHPAPYAPAPAQTTQPAMTAQQAQEKAFENFRNSTGYQFRVNEGQDAINTGYAARGTLQSGAALKALDNYRQNMASGEFGNYMGALSQQQGVGLSGASALAGVGQNYAANVGATNQANADAIGNAALAKASVNQGMWGGIAGAAGTALGALGGSSYQRNPYGIAAGNIY